MEGRRQGGKGGETNFSGNGLRKLRLVGRTGLCDSDKLIVVTGRGSWMGRDAVSATVESTLSRNARLTALGTSMLNPY